MTKKQNVGIHDIAQSGQRRKDFYMPDIFSTECDYIINEKYYVCEHCYRYDICKKYYEENKDKFTLSTGIDELIRAIPND